MTITAPNASFKLFVNEVDFTEYVIPESVSCTAELRQGTFHDLKFRLRQMPDTMAIQGGQRVDLYLPDESTPYFSGQIIRNEPYKHSVSGWTYSWTAHSWEAVFYRKKSYLQFRNLTYQQAVELVLQDPDQDYPNIIDTDVADSTGELAATMPFHSMAGVFPGDIFTRVALLTSTAWRVNYVSTSDFQVEFYNPYTYNPSIPLLFSNSTENFHWKEFKPVYDTNNLINTQTVRGSIVPSSARSTALFRGDGLSSKFPLPLKPYNNINRVELYDSFDGSGIDTRTWLESDTNDDHVYQDGDGFLQFDITGSPEWVGVESRANIERQNEPAAVIDITWITDGACVMGLSKAAIDTGTPESFLTAGIKTDASGVVSTVLDGVATPTSLNLSGTNQYRFRIRALATGSVVEYQEGADLYSRTWTQLASGGSDTDNDLKVVIYSYDANFNVDMVKCTNPFLGITVEVDRGKGFEAEYIGLYPVDEDVDVVLEGDNTISFFGSDPGPSTIPPAPTSKEFETADLALDTITVIGGHGLATGTAVTLTTTNTLPAGLSLATTYYVRAESFTLATLYTSEAYAIAGGATGRVNITGTGTGTHTMNITQWADKDSDYKNIRITYYPGQRLQATFRDGSSISTIASLFGLGDSGIREGNIIVDETLTSYQACLSRAQLEVENNNKIVRYIRMSSSYNVLKDAGHGIPRIGEVGRFNVNISATDASLFEDLPIVSITLRAKTGANDFDLDFNAGFLQKGIKDVIESLQDSLFISINDSELLYKSAYGDDNITFTEDFSVLSYGLSNWGDSRLNKTFTVNTGTDVLTTASNVLTTGQPVHVSTTGTLPAPLLPYTHYWANRISATTFYLYDTQDNAIAGGATGRVNLTTTGSGTHTLSASGFRWNYHKWSSFFVDTARIKIIGSNCTNFTVV